MSIRVLVCVAAVLFFSLYAWRNYFVSLCAAIVLMAIMQHPDVVGNLKNIGGIQGLNPFNLLLGNILLSWLRNRQHEGMVWDMPRVLERLLLGYALVVTISVLRLLANPAQWPEPSATWMISEYFINCFKWVLPGIILFDACRSRRRIKQRCSPL